MVVVYYIIIIIIIIILSTTAILTCQVVGTLKSSSLIEGWQKFRLQTIGFEPMTFWDPKILEWVILMSHHPWVSLFIYFHLPIWIECPLNYLRKIIKKFKDRNLMLFKFKKNTTLNSTWILEFGVQTWFYDNLLSNT
jgi:hypothetical protein